MVAGLPANFHVKLPVSLWQSAVTVTQVSLFHLYLQINKLAELLVF